MQTIKDNQVTQTLTALHEKAAADQLLRGQQRKAAAEQSKPYGHHWDTAYLAISKEQGRFLYLLANLAKAKQIVEFGCSFGISTIYLAAAAKDLGGQVITTDIEPAKINGAKDNLCEAGLADQVTFLLGDATQTFASIEGPIDLLFLDGAKELYLPVFQLLYPQLSLGAVIVADNADNPGTHALIAHIERAGEEFITAYLFEGKTFVAYRNHNH